MRNTLCLSVLLVVILCPPSPASANVVVLVPCTTDAFAASTNNFTADVQAPVFSDILHVSLFGPDETRAALEFDISALPPAGTIIGTVTWSANRTGERT